MAVSHQAVATNTQIDLLSINTIRSLSMDGVQKANSGHPGTPMALAPAAYILWQKFLRYDPEDPLWPNRDRFVLSNGHASMLLYSLIHLAGIRAVNKKGEVLPEPSLSIDDLKRFRQIDSKTPGHPEYGVATGVETTTGPLGQGVATSVGMAIAGKWLGANFNRPGFELFDYNVWVFCGDGDLMEGVSSEAASLAGHLKLSNLCWLYDNNHITIEGKTDLAFSEDVALRFKSYGWDVKHVPDANDVEALAKNVPWLMGGAADLYPSTKTRLTFEGAGDFQPDQYQGRNFHFGIREHGMGAIVNGMTLCNVRPYGSTFFIFTDYMKPPMRLSALMEIPAIWIFTHDSIGLGEDGPTHQSIEQLATLRAVPGMMLLRPGDANEVVEAYKIIMKSQHEPAVLVLTRQALPTLDRTKYAPAAGVARGAYVLADAEGGKPQVILIGTGSEVSLC